LVRGGAAEPPVIYQKRGGETEQCLDWQERDLPTACDGTAAQNRTELLLRLADGQLKVICQFGHASRLLPGMIR